MAFREFFVRHRIASAVAAPAILGVAAVTAVTFTFSSPKSDNADPQLTSSVTECHDMVTISVAGRGDTPAAGTTKMLVDANGNELPAALSGDHSSNWLDPVVNAPDGAVASDSYAAIYIAYPANMATYEDAVNAGVANAEQVMRDISAACPGTKFSIVGYSEGADVVRRVAMQVGNQEAGADGKYGIVDPGNVVGVVILADSGRSADEGPFPGAKDPNHPDGFDTNYQDGGVKPVAGQGALTGNQGDFGKLNGKVASFCSDGDLTCSAPKNISLLQLMVNVGRQINADRLEKEGLNPTTGMDVAVELGKIAMDAFADIQSQPNWMASKETFLDVLLRVSDPAYKGPSQNPQPVAQADSIAAENMSPLAYLPQKVFNEVVNLIVTNQNTIPVIMSDPYNLTLGPNGTGHHFDYWRDNTDGKPLTSAEYAAAWLTELAKEAQAGQLNTTTQAPAARAAAVAPTTTAATTPATTTTPPATTTPAEATKTPVAATTVPTMAPATTTAPETTTTVPPATTPEAKTPVAAPTTTITTVPATTTTTIPPTTPQPAN